MTDAVTAGAKISSQAFWSSTSVAASTASAVALAFRTANSGPRARTTRRYEIAPSASTTFCTLSVRATVQRPGFRHPDPIDQLLSVALVLFRDRGEVEPLGPVDEPVREFRRVVRRENHDRLRRQVFEGRQPELSGLVTHIVRFVDDDDFPARAQHRREVELTENRFDRLRVLHARLDDLEAAEFDGAELRCDRQRDRRLADAGRSDEQPRRRVRRVEKDCTRKTTSPWPTTDARSAGRYFSVNVTGGLPGSDSLSLNWVAG